MFGCEKDFQSNVEKQIYYSLIKLEPNIILYCPACLGDKLYF